jgi:FkbM family methyltransferase
MRRVHNLIGAALHRGTARPIRSAYGVEMAPNWSDKTYAYCHYGTYGRYLADLIGALDGQFAFLDVGANQGLFSLIAGRNPACETIIALDPVPATHARLEANLAAAGLEGRATALNLGLSDRAGTAEITLGRSHSGLATLGEHLAKRGKDAGRIEIELVTARELVHYLPGQLPIFVKIDVEGHEAVVIEELLGSSLAPRIVGIFYEHDDRWSDAARTGRALAKAGFAERRRYGRGRHYDVLATPNG